MNETENVLVIGAGIAGMEASLLIAKTGKIVYLVEKLPLIGGNAIKNEESFPNFECSTCMVAPIQQEILQSSNIQTMTLSTVKKIEGEIGNFTATIHQRARFVSLTDCIGCDMCYEPCPVSLINEWEENLSEKKAIYVPCAGSLPNVPTIDADHCLQLSGKKECNACAEACMFGAIDLTQKDEDVEIQVGAIIIAVGSELYDVSALSNLGYGNLSGVYTAMEFERLFASNGPTQGELTLRNSEKTPESIAIIHCVGREERGYCSGICCMYSLKYAHFLRHKLPDAKIYNLHTDICVPGKSYQKFFTEIKEEGTKLLYNASMDSVKVTENEGGLKITYLNNKGNQEAITVDMVILAPAVIPQKDNSLLSQIAGIDQDEYGFLQSKADGISSTETTREGIYMAGCVEGPKDMQASVSQAESAVGKVISVLN